MRQDNNTLVCLFSKDNHDGNEIKRMQNEWDGDVYPKAVNSVENGTGYIYTLADFQSSVNDGTLDVSSWYVIFVNHPDCEKWSK